MQSSINARVPTVNPARPPRRAAARAADTQRATQIAQDRLVAKQLHHEFERTETRRRSGRPRRGTVSLGSISLGESAPWADSAAEANVSTPPITMAADRENPWDHQRLAFKVQSGGRVERYRIMAEAHRTLAEAYATEAEEIARDEREDSEEQNE